HSTYVDRIRLLSAISPDSSMDGTDGIESDQTSTENNNDGNKQNENSTDLINAGPTRVFIPPPPPNIAPPTTSVNS
ncbi:14713_t:CDS:2, partial [Entrophospora sp. SA101]